MSWLMYFIRWLNGVSVDSAAAPAASTVQAPKGATAPADDPIVGPAFSWLVSKWTSDERRTLLDVQKALGYDPLVGGLAVVIDEESGGDPTVPKKKEGTPRGGLNQLTVGANLPGFNTPESVWSIREWPITRQLQEVVKPYFARMNLKDSTPKALLRQNFLPSDASKPDDFKLGEAVKDSSGKYITNRADVPSGHKLSQRESFYYANPYYDAGKRGFFTWSDIDKKAAFHLAKAGGKWVTVSGRVVSEPGSKSGGAVSSAAAPAALVASPSASSSSASSAVSSSPAPALLALRAAVDAQWPNRAKASDGIMGDAAHQKAGKSDHNHGDALDITRDPKNGPDLDILSDSLVRDHRVNYVIYNRRIRNPAISGGAWRAYNGASPHTEHLHVSVHAAKRSDVGAWSVAPFSMSAPSAPASAPSVPSPTSSEREEIDYKDGGKVSRKAAIEGGKTLVITVSGKELRLPLDKATTLTGTGAAPVTPAVAHAAYALLSAYGKWGKSFGYKSAVTIDGQTYVALYEEHPPDTNPKPHPGVTMLKTS